MPQSATASQTGWWVAGFAALLGAFLLWMGSHAFPLLGDDSSCFSGVALSIKRGLGLVNPVDYYAGRNDPSGQFRFTYYPPLFQYATAALMAKDTVASLMMSLAILEVIALFSMTFLWWQFLKRHELTGNVLARVLLVFSMLGVLSYLSGGTNGRPEVLAMVWLSWWCYVLFFMDNAHGFKKDLLLGLLLGLDAATQPVSAVMAGTMTVLYYTVVETSRHAVIRSLIMVASAFSVFAALLQTLGYGLLPTVEAMLLHARRVLIYPNLQPAIFIQMYLTSAHFTGYGFILLSAWGTLVYLLKNHKAQILSWLVFAVLLGLFWHFAWRAPTRNYNIFCFMPLLLMANMYLVCVITPKLSTRIQSFLPMLLAVLTASTMIGFARKAFLFFVFLSQGVSLDEAREDYLRLPQPKTGNVYVTDSMWALADEHSHMRYWADRLHVPADAEMIIVQNNVYVAPNPPEIPGYRIIFNSFSHQPVTLAGFSLSRRMPGYEFAAYVPETQKGTP